MLPQGFKLHTEVSYEDDYKVPTALQMKESEKIALELVDYLIDRAAGFHILTSVPRRVTRSVVKVDHDNL